MEFPSIGKVLLTAIFLLIARFLIKYIIRPIFFVSTFRKVRDVHCDYSPIMGIIAEQERCFAKYDDIHYASLKRITTNPDLRMSVVCFLDKIYLDLYDPGLIKEFLNKQTRYTIKEPKIFGALDDIVKEGLVFVEGDKWKSQRKLISQVFHFDYMNLFIPNISNISDEWIQEHCNQQVSNVNVHLAMKQYTSGLIWKMFFGNEEGFCTKEESDKILKLSIKSSANSMDVCFSVYNFIFGPSFFKLGLRPFDRLFYKESRILEDHMNRKLTLLSTAT